LKITEYLVKDILKISGIGQNLDVLIVPMATGMALSLVFNTIRVFFNPNNKKIIVWNRID
jgi:hypothetical protein